MALWVIGYGLVQAFAPKILRGKDPTGKTATWLAFVLTLIPILIGVGLHHQWHPASIVLGGLIGFGIAFALNSAVHSFLILDYTDHDKVAMNVGIYYMANACGRLIGTVLSGLLYQVGLATNGTAGLIYCLIASAGFLFITGIISLALPRRPRAK